MTLAIVTAKTKRLWPRKPDWPYTINWDSPQARGLSSWWSGDPVGSRTTMFDLVKGGNGTLTNGPLWVGASDGSNSLAVDLDGTDDYILFSATGLGAGSSTFAWVKPDSLAGGDVRLWGSVSGTTGGNIRTFGTNLQALNSAGGAWNTIATGLVVGWQHLGAVYLANSTCTGYRNGVAGTNVAATAPNFWQSQAWTFGSRYGGFGTYFNGSFHDLRVYSCEVPQPIIADMFNPDTRWDLYYQLGQRSWFLPSTETPTPATFNSAWMLNCNKLLGGGIC